MSVQSIQFPTPLVRFAASIGRPIDFEYEKLPLQLAREAMDLSDRFRAMHRQTVISILHMGGELLAMKEKLGHGRFGRWLYAEFGGGARTAQRYMRAAGAFADKYDTVSHLPPATIYALAAPSTPGAVREDVLQRLEAKERLPAEVIDAMVRHARRKPREASPAEPTSRLAEESADHVIALSAVLSILRQSLGDNREEFIELLRDIDPDWTVAQLADRL